MGFRSENSLDDPSGLTSSYCLPCNQKISGYDWAYLAFMWILQLVSYFPRQTKKSIFFERIFANRIIDMIFFRIPFFKNCEYYIIDKIINRMEISMDALFLHLSATIEVTIAAIFSWYVYSDPSGSWQVSTCPTVRLNDWYTVLNNPTRAPYDRLRCTYEAVYPLYSIIFSHLFFSLITLLSIRIILTRFLRDGSSIKTIYLTMYLIPTIAFVHLFAAGLICKLGHFLFSLLSFIDFFIFPSFILTDHSYPLLMFIVSLVSIARHLALRLNQTFSALLYDTFKNLRFTLILFLHFFMHGFALMILLGSLTNSFFLILTLVPIPFMFYVFTSKYTDPSNFCGVDFIQMR